MDDLLHHFCTHIITCWQISNAKASQTEPHMCCTAIFNLKKSGSGESLICTSY